MEKNGKQNIVNNTTKEKKRRKLGNLAKLKAL